MEIEPLIIAIHRQYARVHQLLQQSDRNFDKLRENFTLSGNLRTDVTKKIETHLCDVIN